MTTLRDAILVRWGTACTEDCPLPVTEVLTSNSEIVRVPAWDDGRYLWQGATFTRYEDRCYVRMDDGRLYLGTAEQVANFFHDHADLWQYANGHPESYFC